MKAVLARWGLRGTALVYLGLMVVLPLSAAVTHGYAQGFTALRDALAQFGGRQAIILTLWMAVLTAVVNMTFGTLVAYVLTRYQFPGRGFVSAVVDIPFAIPTLVTGLMLVALYGPVSPFGGFLGRHGIHIIFAEPGILLALLFVTLPLVVRTVQPVLLELDLAEQEAARVLGAGRLTTFRKVVFPAIRSAHGHASLNELRELIALDQQLAGEPVLQSFASASGRVGQSQLQKLRQKRQYYIRIQKVLTVFQAA